MAFNRTNHALLPKKKQFAVNSLHQEPVGKQYYPLSKGFSADLYKLGLKPFKMVPTDNANTAPTTALAVYHLLGYMMKLLYPYLDNFKFDFMLIHLYIKYSSLKTHFQFFSMIRKIK